MNVLHYFKALLDQIVTEKNYTDMRFILTKTLQLIFNNEVIGFTPFIAVIITLKVKNVLKGLFPTPQ